jgi:hypothetical protein
MSIFEDQIIAALPWGMRDSWRNLHPLLQAEERLYYKGVVKTFSKDELETICEDFEALVPLLPMRRDGMTAEQHMALIVQFLRDVDAIPMRRAAFFNQHTANAKMIMEKAIAIDKAVRAKARKDRQMNKRNRDSRAQFFKECAEVDLPDVPAEVVRISQPILAAIRIGTNRRSLRSWAILKPKIRKEWETVYTEEMKKEIWGYDEIQKEQKRMAEQEIEEKHAADEESLVEKETILVEEELTDEDRVEEEQAEEVQDEEEGEDETYSIWKDRDL